MSLAPTCLDQDGRLRYLSRINKAGALLSDTRTLFANWESDQSVDFNIERIRSLNLLGKVSRARVEDILKVFRHRYLENPAVARALAVMVNENAPLSTLNSIFYFHTVRSDLLLHDVVTDLLAPSLWQGTEKATTGEIEGFIRSRLAEAGIPAWADLTVRRGARGILATLRDFGILAGRANKRLTPAAPPIAAFAYAAFVLDREIRSGDRLLNSPEWRLFFLSPAGVERLLIEAQQSHLLQYHAAGRVIRIDFPTDSIEEYAHALAQATD